MLAARKKILVLSDNEGVARTIQAALKSRSEVVKLTLRAGGQPEWRLPDDACDLLIVALSSFSSEPVVVLAQASLADQIGHVPLLIISDKPFDSDHRNRIVHLDFPFTFAQLDDRVNLLLKDGEVHNAQRANLPSA